MSDDLIKRLRQYADEGDEKGYLIIPEILREAADALEARKVPEWLPIESAPYQGAVLLSVSGLSVRGDRETRTFVAEMSHGEKGSYWMITTSWTGWSKLHPDWMPNGWQPLPAPKDQPNTAATNPEIDAAMYAQGFTGTPGTGRFG